MFCRRYINITCVDGYCPAALYYEYGADYGFSDVSCNECGYADGFCESCVFEGSDICPLDYVLAEAVPVYEYADYSKVICNNFFSAEKKL